MYKRGLNCKDKQSQGKLLFFSSIIYVYVNYIGTNIGGKLSFIRQFRFRFRFVLCTCTLASL